jgi:uncharacterized protein (TIGR02246 family)
MKPLVSALCATWTWLALAGMLSAQSAAQPAAAPKPQPGAAKALATPAAGAPAPVGAPGQPASPEEAAIRKNAALYVDAYNRRDAKALAELWAPEAVYIDPDDGQQVATRPEIEKYFAGVFADAGQGRLEVDVTSVEFLSPDVAIERGLARMVIPNEPAETTAYAAISVRQAGQWLLDRITERDAESQAPPSHYAQLKDLDWMIGSWVDDDEHARVETTCRWAKNQNFITRAFTVEVDGVADLSGMQIIGWDPAEEKIRSWAFDSDGGFAEATWKNDGKRWLIEAASTLPDGRRGSSINIMTPLDENSMTWQMTGREVDGEILPNTPEVKINRVSQP